MSTEELQGKLISDLPEISQVSDDAFIEIEQDGQSARARASSFKSQGPKGDDGKDGKDGIDGKDGKSALEVAIENDPEVTDYESWRESLKGEDGKDGLSALEVAMQEDESITDYESWQESLKGADGEKGEDGAQGEDGKSAYELAVENGFEGTEEEWLDTLRAEAPVFFGPIASESELPEAADTPTHHIYFVKDNEGVTNTFSAVDGQWVNHGDFTGPRGKSAYEQAVENGFIGSVLDWLESLHGQDGIGLRILGSFSSTDFLPEEDMESGDSYIIQEKMYVWDGSDWSPVGQVGPAGKSAYRHAQDQGFVGSLQDWLDSLVGPQGPRGPVGKSALDVVMEQDPSITDYESWQEKLRGRSALEVAIENDPEVTDYDSWRESLKGDQGDPANVFVILDTFDSEDDLPASAEPGQAYIVDGDIFGWTGTEFKNFGPIQGPEGPQGPRGKSALQVAMEEDESVTDYDSWRESLRGADGKSALQVAIENDPEVTDYESWRASLKGADGKDGVDGSDGEDGKSALEVAMDEDPSITDYESWRESLKGEDGKDGINFIPVGTVATSDDLPEDVAINTVYRVGDDGYVYTEEGWINVGPMGIEGPEGPEGPQGPEGKSALEVAIENDPEVTDYESWRESLKGEDGKDGADGKDGEDGKDGKSALEIAIDEDPNITDYASFMASLKGADGTPLNPKGSVATLEDLEETVDPQALDYYHVGTHAYVYDGSAWVDFGDLSGPEGPEGPEGRSAFEIAKNINPDLESEEEWIESLKGETGPDGLSILDVVKAENPNIETVEDLREYLRGERGPEGPEGPQGPMGPALTIIDELESEDDLPESGEIGDAYLIDGDFWGWSDALGTFKNMGPVQGPEGPRGPQGEEGPRGATGKSAYEEARENDPSITNFNQFMAKIKGDKGDRGQYWYVEARDPGPVDGVIGDMFMNKDTQEIFRKTGQTTWAPMGHLGGGNVYDAVHDDKYYVRLNGTWVELPFGPIESEGMWLGTKDGWVRFDNYDLPTTNVDTELVIDGNEHQVFTITLDEPKTVSVPDFDKPGRTKTLVVIAYGDSALTLTGNINWGDAGMPDLGEDFTVLTMLWDNEGEQWLCAGGASGANL